MALIAHYKFEDNVNDDTINFKNGTATDITYVNGKIGKAVSFNGTSSKIIFLEDAFPKAANPFSISLWVKGVKGADYSYIFHKGADNSIGNSVCCIVTDENGKFRFVVNGDYTSGLSNASISDSFQHLVLSWDGSVVKGYVNANKVIEYPLLNITNDIANSKMGFGMSFSTISGRYFCGEIDDVRIYDHDLSLKEIKDLSQCKLLHYSFDDFAEPTENLLSNGDFANGFTNWSITPLNTGARVYTYEIKSDQDGNYAHIHLENVSATGDSYPYIKQAIPLNKNLPNVPYTLSVLVRINSYYGSGSGTQVRLSAILNDYWTADRKTWSFSNRTIGVWHKVELTSTFDPTYYRDPTTYPLAIHFEIYSANLISAGDMIDFDIKLCQIEQKDHATPFVNGTRGRSENFIDKYGLWAGRPFNAVAHGTYAVSTEVPKLFSDKDVYKIEEPGTDTQAVRYSFKLDLDQIPVWDKEITWSMWVYLPSTFAGRFISYYSDMFQNSTGTDWHSNRGYNDTYSYYGAGNIEVVKVTGLDVAKYDTWQQVKMMFRPTSENRHIPENNGLDDNKYIAGFWRINPDNYTTPYHFYMTAGEVYINEDNILDISGNDFDGSLNELTTPKWSNNTVLGKGCYEFDGTKFLDIGNPIKYGSTEFSVFGVVKLNDVTTQSPIIGQWNGSSGPWLIDVVNGSIRFVFADSSTTKVLMSSVAINTVYYFLATWKLNGDMKFYVNGILAGSTTSSGIAQYFTYKTVLIGKKWDVGSTMLNGTLYELGICGKELTSQDAVDFYQSRANLDNNGNLSVKYVQEINNLLYDGRIFTSNFSRGSWSTGSVVEIASLSGVNPLYGYTHALALSTRDSYLGGGEGNVNTRIKVRPGDVIYFSMLANTQATTQQVRFGYRAYSYQTNAAIRNWPSIAYLDAGKPWTRVSAEMIIPDSINVEGVYYTVDEIIPFLQIPAFDNFGSPLVQELYIGRRPLTETEPIEAKYFEDHKKNYLESTGNYRISGISEIGVTRGLVAWYPLNGDAGDYVSGNDGIPTNITYQSGYRQLSAYFNKSAHIQIPQINETESGLTVSAWVYKIRKAVGDLDRHIILSNAGSFVYGGYTLAILEDNKFGFWTYASIAEITSNAFVFLNTWYHVTAQDDPAGYKRIYINGELDKEVTSTLVCADAPYNLYIGARGDLYSESKMYGYIQDVRIYNVALSPEEVKINYERSKELFPMRITKDGLILTNIKEV